METSKVARTCHDVPLHDKSLARVTRFSGVLVVPEAVGPIVIRFGTAVLFWANTKGEEERAEKGTAARAWCGSMNAELGIMNAPAFLIPNSAASVQSVTCSDPDTL
jgi:hypothetical protein